MEQESIVYAEVCGLGVGNFYEKVIWQSILLQKGDRFIKCFPLI